MDVFESRLPDLGSALSCIDSIEEQGFLEASLLSALGEAHQPDDWTDLDVTHHCVVPELATYRVFGFRNLSIG